VTSDSQLKRLVLGALQKDPKVDHAHIGVTATDGAVGVTGHVFSYASKFATTDAVKRVRGVWAISDEVEVNLPTEHRRDDADIAKNIAHLLDWSVSITGNNVVANVRSGFVMLSGEVDRQHQREYIEKQISQVGSITGIANRIALKSKINPANVMQMIEDALQRNAGVGVNVIEVSVKDRTVVLHGDVKAHYERDIIEKADWTAPGGEIHRGSHSGQLTGVSGISPN
jgi:osmotically-inducible protein OsmY